MRKIITTNTNVYVKSEKLIELYSFVVPKHENVIENFSDTFWFTNRSEFKLNYFVVFRIHELLNLFIT